MRLSWWTIAGITGLSLLILRTGISTSVVLGACATVVVGALIWDRYEKRQQQKKRDSRIVWADLLSCHVKRIEEDGHASLYARLANISDRRVTLPPIALSLGYTTFAGGSPGAGGNGLDAINLKDDIAGREVLGPGDSIDLAIDTATDPVRPAPFPRALTKRQGEDEAAWAKRQAILDAKYQTLVQEVSEAPSLAAFMEGAPGTPFFLDLRPDGQYPGFGFIHHTQWTEAADRG